MQVKLKRGAGRRWAGQLCPGRPYGASRAASPGTRPQGALPQACVFPRACPCTAVFNRRDRRRSELSRCLNLQKRWFRHFPRRRLAYRGGESDECLLRSCTALRTQRHLHPHARRSHTSAAEKRKEKKILLTSFKRCCGLCSSILECSMRALHAQSELL